MTSLSARAPVGHRSGEPDAQSDAGATPIERLLCGRAFITALVLLGVALRLWAYASNTALWLDEILLSRNITELPLRELLTQPLGLDQVAPRGFLLVERLAVAAFGQSELALRLFPFLCGLAGLFLFRRLAERALDGLAVPFAIALFAIGLPFIKYSAEVKQYGIDATVAILLTLLAFDVRDRAASTTRLLLVGAVRLVVIWVSQASVLVMAGIGVAFAGTAAFRVARASVREYLGTIGVKRDSLSLPSLTWGTAVIELYDLSDAARLRAANPEAFPVPPMPTDPRPGCRPWSQPDSVAGVAAPRR